MEIVVAPPPPTTPGWVRLLVVLAVCAPVTLLALLPTCFGLDRYVVTGDEMVPDLARGTLLIERSVPVSDLRAGDIVTFDVPGADGRRTLTCRVVAVDEGRVRTAAEALPAADPFAVDQRRPVLHRVVVAVPWVGFVYVGAVHAGPALATALILVGAVLLAVALASGRRRRATPARQRL